MGQRGFVFHYLSSHPHWDGTKEVALADLDTAVTQNVVGGGVVKEVWQHKVVEVVDAFHVAPCCSGRAGS